MCTAGAAEADDDALALVDEGVAPLSLRQPSMRTVNMAPVKTASGLILIVSFAPRSANPSGNQ